MGDLISVCLLVWLFGAFVVGFQKGFVKQGVYVLTMLGSILLAPILYPICKSVLQSCSIYDTLVNSLQTIADIIVKGGSFLTDGVTQSPLPKIAINGVVRISTEVGDLAGNYLVSVGIRFCCIILSIVIMRLLITAIGGTGHGLEKLPGIKQVNPILGGVASVFFSLFWVWVLMILFSIFSGLKPVGIVLETMLASKPLAFLYNYNPLLLFFY